MESLPIFEKSFILYIWLGSAYAYDFNDQIANQDKHLPVPNQFCKRKGIFLSEQPNNVLASHILPIKDGTIRHNRSSLQQVFWTTTAVNNSAKKSNQHIRDSVLSKQGI